MALTSQHKINNFGHFFANFSSPKNHEFICTHTTQNIPLFIAKINKVHHKSQPQNV